MKWFWFSYCVLAGLALLACGLLIPAHLRALESGVLQRAGNGTPGVVQRGLDLAGKNKLGAAQLFAKAGLEVEVQGADQFAATVADLVRQNPSASFWGDDSRTETVFAGIPAPSNAAPTTFTEFVAQKKNRAAALAHLQESRVLAVQELLRSRSLTNTVLFPSAQSAAGQAFDAAVGVCGLLLEGGYLQSSFDESILKLAMTANQGGSSEPLEATLMDLMSLGERLNWDQLTAFVGPIRDADTLRLLAAEIRKTEDHLPMLFAAVELSGEPGAVANYIVRFHQTGFTDLGASLRSGAGGVQALLKSQQRVYDSDLVKRAALFEPLKAAYHAAADFVLRFPRTGMAVKWFCYLSAGFLLAAALHFARPSATVLERPLLVRGFHLYREFLFSIGFLLVALCLSEPFLAQPVQKENFSFRLHLPMMGGAVPAGIAGIKPTLMNPTTLLTLSIFFLIQLLIYVACLVKLAEIRRQKVAARLKLRLLDVEDHLFDAGLYLGFVGTIISLIVASLGLVKFSLMAAYSSTSFGIIFVVIFKIFHLRPVRRQLLLEAEASAAEAAAAGGPR